MNLAARGSRHLADKPEKIEDAGELAQVRQQARGVHLKALLTALLLTALTLPLP